MMILMSDMEWMFFMLLLVLMLVELAAACLLLVYEKAVDKQVEKDLSQSLDKIRRDTAMNNSSSTSSDWDLMQNMFDCCGVHNMTDWNENVPPSCCKDPCTTEAPVYKEKGCLVALRAWFDKNFLTTGIAIIVLCVIEVLGMCFSMTLFCHISRSGLGYKL